MMLTLWWADGNDRAHDHIAVSLHWEELETGYDYLATALNGPTDPRPELEPFCEAFGIGQDEVVWAVDDLTDS